MTTFTVTNKATGQLVYRYESDESIEWSGMEFATHDHAAVAAPAAPPKTIVPSEWWMHVGPFYDRFGAFKLAILSSADPLVQAVIKDTAVRKYIDLVGRRAELLQVIDLLQSKGFAVSAAAILDVKPTAAEVFNG